MTKAQSSKFKIQNDNNPLESLRNFDNYEDDDEYESLGFNLAKKKEKRAKKEFKVFNYQEYSETTLIKKKISELSELIKKEIEDTYKLEFILSEIADKENIKVEKEDLDKLFTNIKEEKERKAAEANSYFYASILRKQKTLDFLISL